MLNENRYGYNKYQNSVFALVGLVLLVAIFVIDRSYNDFLVESERASFHYTVDRITSSLSNQVNSRFALLIGLNTFSKTVIIPTEIKGKKKNFDMFAAGLYSSARGIRNFIVAPGGINTFVYPIARNQKAVGHNQLKDERPNVQADVERALRDRGMVLSGPYELRQGGLGLVCRMAVFDGDTFWGLVSMVLDINPVLEEAGLYLPINDFQFALVGNDGKVFDGDGGILNQHPVSGVISLPDGSWELSLIPSMGWNKSYLLSLYIWRFFATVIWLGIVYGVYSMTRQQKRLEKTVLLKTEEIHQRKAILDFALQVSQTGLWDLNLVDHTSLRTPLHDKIFGYDKPLAEWTYEMFLKHVYPDDRAETDRLFQEAVEAQKPWLFECRIQRADGEVRWIHACGDQGLDPNGNVTRMTGVVRDITARKESERSLQLSEERFSYAMDATDDGIYDWDLNSNEVYFSPAWKSMLGYTYNELPNDLSVWERLTSPEDFKLAWDLIEKLLNKEQDKFKIEFKMKHKQGHWVNILSRAKAFFNEQGEVVRVVGTHIDVTERVNMELQLAMAQKLESIGQLAAGIAHEINTPIQYISGNLGFMRDSWAEFEDVLGVSMENGNTPPTFSPAVNDSIELMKEWKQAIGDSIEGVDQVSKIVQAMKQFTHPGTMDFRSADLNEIINNTVIITRNEWKYVAEVETDLDEEMPYVFCHPGEINQVIVNLLVNSAHAIALKDGDKNIKGLIKITTFQEAEMAVLSIQDNGCGIPEKNINRVFDHFFTTKELGKGTGQGLAIAYAIIKKHSGSISVESRENLGTTFTIKLPIEGRS
ncbi:PAS domain-containing protein [Maridesulfovibrio frigidus]|uniref:PAS domain-containing protein n=1 Tax=Maridesulfovibrio frigidus TaxID=340956 RepID=UPI00068B9BD1|nr:PAS domain-containing protein [Maridesulfovibrio frigidus]